MTLKLHWGNTVFQTKEKTWRWQNSNLLLLYKVETKSTFIRGIFYKNISMCVLYSFLLSWVCGFGCICTRVFSSSEGKRLLWLDKQSCEAQWVVSMTWGDTKDQSRHADTSACSDWVYVERRCVPWLKLPWNGANQL